MHPSLKNNLNYSLSTLTTMPRKKKTTPPPATDQATQAILNLPQLKSYEHLATKVDLDSGEVSKAAIPKYRYFEGRPRQYRFNAKDGEFNINGDTNLGDSFSFQPFAWRIFRDDILNMGKKTWAELFFIDKDKCVSALLFHGYSVEELYKLMEPLFYEDMILSDVILTVSCERKENANIQPKATYFIATFSYKKAVRKLVNEFQDYGSDFKIFRQETLTDLAEIHLSHNYYNPNLNGNKETP